MTATRSYLVCATPRSGSTLLCHLLAQTRVAGCPEEYFEALAHSGVPRRPYEYFDADDHPELVARLRASFPGEAPPHWSHGRYGEYLAEVLDRGTTPNGVFGAKLMWGYAHDFQRLLRTIPQYAGMEFEDLLPAVFPNLHYVRVVRRERLRQAVSLWRAIQTAAWRRHSDEDQPEDREVAYDGEAIEALCGQLADHDRAWDAFFERAAVEPHVVVYEDFVDAREATVRSVLEHVGVDAPADLTIEPPLERQADERSRAWAERFVAEQRSEASSSSSA